MNKYVIHEKISVADWILMNDCPIQRNTEIHARKALSKHLKSYSNSHTQVIAARLPDETMYKLDGHTRSHLWKIGKLIPPIEDLDMIVYICPNLEYVYKYYKEIDSIGAVENANDKTSGAFRLYNFNPESKLIKRKTINQSISLILNISYSSFDVYRDIESFIPVIRIIDKEMFKSTGYPCGIFSALLITVNIDRENSMDFWRSYNEDQGVKSGKERDGVQALTEVFSNYKSSDLGHSNNVSKNICGQALKCYKSFKEMKLLTNAPSSIDMYSYINSHIKKLDPINDINNKDDFLANNTAKKAIRGIQSGKFIPSIKNLSEEVGCSETHAEFLLLSMHDTGILIKDYSGGYKLSNSS